MKPGGLRSAVCLGILGCLVMCGFAPQDETLQQPADVAAADSAASALDDARQLVADWEFAKAESLARRLLVVGESRHGRRSLQVAEVMDVLVESIALQHPPGLEGEEMARRAVAIKDSILGPEHPGLAVSLRVLARVQWALGDGNGNGERENLQRALAIQEKVLGPRHPEVAETLSMLGTSYRRKQEYQAARQMLERSLQIREAVLGPEHRDVGRTLMQLGMVSISQQDLVGARQCWERQLDIFEKEYTPTHRALVHILNNLGALTSTHEGRDAESLRYYERALGIVEKLDPWKSDDRVKNQYLNLLRNISSAYINLGDYSTARTYVERVLDDTEKMRGREDYQYTQALYHLWSLLLLAGDYVEVRALIEESIEILPMQAEDEEFANRLRDLGAVEFATGDLERADSLLARAQGIYERHDAPNPNEVNEHDQCRRQRAKVLLARGDYESATRVLQESLTFLGLEHAYRGETLASLGAASALAGDLQQARDHYTQGLRVLEEAFGDKNPLLARSLRDYSWVLAQLEETEEAFATALRAEQLGRDHLQGLIRSVHERQALRFAAARASGLDVVLSLAARHPEIVESREALDAVVCSRSLVLDEIAWRHRALGDAADTETVRLLDALAAARRKLANVVFAGPQRGISAERFRGTIETLQKERDQIEGDLATRSAEFQSELALGRAGLEEVGAALPPGAALVSYVRYEQMPEPRVAEGVSIVEGNRPSYLAFVLIAGRSEPAIVDLGAADRIESDVRRWHHEVSAPPGKSKAERVAADTRYRDVGAALRSAVWDPVVAHLGGAHQVFVVPDGALHLVDFAALPVGESEYLVESGPVIHYLSAERDLLHPSAEPVQGRGLLAFGGPSYDDTSSFAALSRKRPSRDTQAEPMQVAASASRVAWESDGTPAVAAGVYRGARSSCGTFESLRFDPLPAARREVAELVALWSKVAGGAKHLTGPAASESAFKQEAPSYRVLHLATHGFFLGGDCASTFAALRGIGGVTPGMEPATQSVGENPLLLSGLALAGANHRSAAGPDEEDGILTAEEIASLDLSGVEWVVLSACETGVGEVKAGEGVFGLRRAFQVAGARTLVMSLWGVEDEATRRWMRELYEARFVRNGSTATAVRDASLAVLHDRRARGESTHPFYWGAFVAAGDWR